MSLLTAALVMMLSQTPQPADSKLKIWDDFITHHDVASESVPLFDVADGQIVTIPYGSNDRLVLKRSPAMEDRMRGLGRQLIKEHRNRQVTHDGILYVMLRLERGRVVPLYIGKAEVYGKGERNLSANISDLDGGNGKFGRWGYGYAYHIGDLSAATLSGHPSDKVSNKYLDWSRALFVTKGDRVEPRFEVRFWATLWSAEKKSIWESYGRTRLAFEEFLLIGVASDAFPDVLLNREGSNR